MPSLSQIILEVDAIFADILVPFATYIRLDRLHPAKLIVRDWIARIFRVAESARSAGVPAYLVGELFMVAGSDSRGAFAS